jgi:hypothetical protein
MIIFITIPLIFANEKSFKIKGKFNYCDKSRTSMIKLDTNCLTYKQTITNRPKFPEFTFSRNNNTFVSIISKRKNTVFGEAFECKISEQKTILKSDFWSRIFPPIKTAVSLEISAKECWDLVESRQCISGQPMICERSGCFNPDPDFKDKYSWYQEVVVSNRKCSFRKLEINADEEHPLFGNENCEPRKGHCSTSDSIIVWDVNKVFHPCPFQILNFAYMTSFENDILYSESLGLAFQVTERIRVCNPEISIYKTTEGLYLAKYVDAQPGQRAHPQFLKSEERTPKITSNMLILSENDNTKVQELRFYKEMNLRNCLAMTNTLYLMTKTLDKQHAIVRDIHGAKFIVYIEEQNIYVPNCTPIEEISVEKETFNCFKHIPIEFETTNKNGSNNTIIKEKAFLSEDLIIIKDNSIIQCMDPGYKKKINIKDSLFLMRFFTNGKTVNILSNQTVVYHQINLINVNISELNFRHSSKIIEENRLQ